MSEKSYCRRNNYEKMAMRRSKPNNLQCDSETNEGIILLITITKL